MSDPELNDTTELQVTNPLQAASEIFYKPKGVFEALAVKDNWSWIPFIIIAVVSMFPAFLYFSLVDFEWWRNVTFAEAMQDMTPAQIDAQMEATKLGVTKWATALGSVFGMVIIFLIIGFYFSLVTKNDEKSVHGFTDWYGALWWMYMPLVVNALISLLILSTYSSGSEISQSVLTPLSLAFLFGTQSSEPAFNLLSSISITSFWTIWLGKICVQTWTNFSANKSLLVSAMPSLFFWVVSLIFLIF